MTPLTIQYTEEDLAEALRAHYRSTGRTRFPVVKVLVILALCISAVRVLVTGDQSIVNGAITSALTFLLIVGAAYAFNAINRSWLIPRHSRTVYAQQKELHSPTTMSWDSEGQRGELIALLKKKGVPQR